MRCFGRGAGVALVLTSLAVAGAGAGGTSEQPTLAVPAGLRVGVFASGLGAPRALTFDPGGALLVSLPSEGRVIVLPDRDGDGRADEIGVVVAGLDRPHGLAFREGRLYIAETGRVVRFRYETGTRRAVAPEVVVGGLPYAAHHWTRSIAFGPDDHLYVAIGSSCDICREQDPRRAAIVRYRADGSGEELVATGLRNPVGLGFHPRTRALWTTVNERDWKDGGAPPDYVTEVTRGASYGWPDCFAMDGRFRPDPEFTGGRTCVGLAAPTLELPPHSAPLGLAFSVGTRLPPPFDGGLFVALHGSRPALPPAGYRVIHVGVDAGRVVGVRDLITGWRDGSRVIGRPVDLAVGRDGALYVSDDHGGRVYRVSAVR